MTYKAVVAGMLERDSSEWIDKLLREHGIKFSFTCSDIEELTQEKDLYSKAFSQETFLL